MNPTNLILLFIILISSQLGIGQIAGISGSKISAFSYDPIPNLEFEPTFNITRSNTFWDENSDRFEDLDSITIASSLCWRITYGFMENLEVGFSVPSDFSTGGLGIKAYLYGGDIFHLSAMAGTNIALGNRTYDKNNPSPDDLSSFGLGLVGSLVFNEKQSIDINFQTQDYFKNDVKGIPTSAYFFNADYGIRRLNDNLLLILGSGFQYYKTENIEQSKWTLYPGISIEFAKNYLIVINTSFDFAGKNIEKQSGFSLSLTTIWE